MRLAVRKHAVPLRRRLPEKETKGLSNIVHEVMVPTHISADGRIVRLETPVVFQKDMSVRIFSKPSFRKRDNPGWALTGFGPAHTQLSELLKGIEGFHVVPTREVFDRNGIRKVSLFKEGVQLDAVLSGTADLSPRHLRRVKDILQAAHERLSERNVFIGDGDPRNIIVSLHGKDVRLHLIDQPFLFKHKDFRVSDVSEPETHFDDFGQDLYEHTLLLSLHPLEQYLRKRKGR